MTAAAPRYVVSHFAARYGPRDEMLSPEHMPQYDRYTMTYGFARKLADMVDVGDSEWGASLTQITDLQWSAKYHAEFPAYAEHAARFPAPAPAIGDGDDDLPF